MAKADPGSHRLSLSSRRLLGEEKPYRQVCCSELLGVLLTHLKSLPLEGILHSSSLGRMSFLKGLIRAHRLSKSLTQVFSTCQTSWEEEKPRCNSPWALWDLWGTRGSIMWHVPRTHSRHILHHTSQQATVTTEVLTHLWAPATESAWGRQYCLEVKTPLSPTLAGPQSPHLQRERAHNAHFEIALQEINFTLPGKHSVLWGTRHKLNAWEFVLSFELFSPMLLPLRACK